MKDNLKEIEIDLSSEYKIKIEVVDQFKESIFSDVYLSARDSVVSILKHSDESGNSYDSYNNIIAFTGERGKGKSSAMISFLESLKSVGIKITKESFLSPFYNENDNLADYSFIDLDVIDPSLFRGNESLFEIVLAKMFSKFKKEIESPNSNSSITDENRRQLVKLFQNVFENLKYTNGNYKNELFNQEALDALIKLSASSNLRESFKSLVKAYLDVMNKNGKTRSVLVIPIDDFDLKIEGVYEMLEDVRQFLITEDVIVLIACKMEQMQQAVEMTIEAHFNNSSTLKPKYFAEFNPPENEIKIKARKYLEKLFPISHQIVLPSIDFLKLDTIISNVKSIKNDLRILEVIYSRESIFFRSDNVLNHIIYDDTLRSLVNLFHSINKGDYELFKKYCSFRFSEFIDEKQLYTLLNCDINLLNSFLAGILHEDFQYSLDQYYVDELKKISESTKYELIQNGDLNAIMYSIAQKINVNDNLLNKLKSIITIYILRNSSELYTNTSSLKTKTISGILSVRHLDQKNRIPYNLFTRKFRDYFKVNFQIKADNFNENQLIIISSFVQNLGNTDRDYMSNDDNIFLNSIRRSGAPHRHFYFSIYTFFIAPMNIINLYSRFREPNDAVKKIELLWKMSKYYDLFMSFDFITEFHESLIDAYKFLSKTSIIKSQANENLHANLVLLFEKGTEYAFNKLNEKYKYLNLDFNDYRDANGVLSLFLDNKDDQKVKDFINVSFENYEYVKTYSSIYSLEEITYVNVIEPLIEIKDYLTVQRLNKTSLRERINRIDDSDFELRDFLNQKSFFDRLFSNNSIQKNRTREELNKHLDRLIENGQSQE